MTVKKHIKGMYRVIVLPWMMVISAVSISYAAAVISDTECREYDQVYYEKPDGYALSRIHLKNMDTDSKLPFSLSSSLKEFSPQGTKHYIIQSPDFKEKGPWNTDIYVLGNRANPMKLKITFFDHGSGGVRAMWLNEKLLFVQVWWGRIVSTDLILDIDTSKWIYAQNANYSNIIMPCDQKMKSR
jgi:hypothetical protein